jgi:aspartyl/asparaginyl beta-hydroxylase (cupin superfamily)
MTAELMHNPDLVDYLNTQTLPGFYSIDQFEFLKEIENNFYTIKNEWDLIKSDQTVYQPWTQDWIVNKSNLWDIISINSRQLHLHRNINPIIRADLMPATLALLKSVLKDKLCDVAISRLKPGTVIFPHRGRYTNTLRCHLGLQIPNGDCKIKVNDEVQSWSVGKLLILDDRLMHEAWNNTEQERTVLIFDFIPDPMPGFFIPVES